MGRRRLLGDAVPLVVMATRDQDSADSMFRYEKTLQLMREMQTRRTPMIAVATEGDDAVAELSALHSWDVVNEAIDVKDGRGDGLRDSPWLKLVGADYVEVAFKAARDADPQALLTYNDYGIEGEDNDSQAKRVAVLTMLRRMRARHIPLDALGIQSHITAGKQYGPRLVEFMTAVRDMGLQIFVTEMDVNDRPIASDIATRDQAVAETYGSFLKLMMQEPAVHAVLTWGITDANTWLNQEDSRKDGLPERCLPFAADNLPKKAFFATREAFDSRRPLPQPARTTE